VHFRIGLDASCSPEMLARIAHAIDQSKIGQVLERFQNM